MAQLVRVCSQGTRLTRVEKPKDAWASTPSVAVAKQTVSNWSTYLHLVE